MGGLTREAEQAAERLAWTYASVRVTPGQDGGCRADCFCAAPAENVIGLRPVATYIIDRDGGVHGRED